MKVFECLAKVLVMASIGVFVGGISGCATGPQAKTMSTNTVLNKKLTVRKLDFSGDAIKPEDVKKSIADALVSSGERPIAYYETLVSPQYGNWETRGIKSNVTVNGIKVDYINGGKGVANSGFISYTQSHIISEFLLSLNDSGDHYEAVLTFPSQINLEPAEFNPFSRPKYLLKDEEIVPNLLSKFNALNNDKISIEKTMRVSGEIAVEFNPDSVFTNYDRKFKRHSGNAANEKYYDFPYRGKTLLLYILVRPYKNGSMVEYRLEMPYRVSDTISISQADIERVKSQVELTAKD